VFDNRDGLESPTRDAWDVREAQRDRLERPALVRKRLANAPYEQGCLVAVSQNEFEQTKRCVAYAHRVILRETAAGIWNDTGRGAA
jgi:hypothetical protein